MIFLLVGGVVSLLVATASRRTADAAQARAEAETLAALSGTLSASDDPLPQLVEQLQVAFDAEHVAVLERAPTPTTTPGRCSPPSATTVPTRPDDADVVVPLHGTEVLVLSGETLGDDDREVLKAFAGQVAIAVQQRELRADAERAAGLAEANELRTALLAAVSHDLRTPLSSIKASVTSLLQRDVDFTPDATQELLETIDEGTDRLNHLVGNLLDMSRLQTGALQLVMRDVGLDEVLPVAIAGLTAGRTGRRRRRRDAAARARRRRAARARDRQRGRERDRVVARRRRRCGSRRAWRSSASSSRSSTADRASRPTRREDVFRPFQRLGDRSNGSGVGLGLAVARGFVEAMGGAHRGRGHARWRRHDGDQPARRRA